MQCNSEFKTKNKAVAGAPINWRTRKMIYIMRYPVLLLFLLLYCNEAVSINGNDSISNILETVVISADRNISPIKEVDMQGISMDMDFMHRLPKILGNADPMRYSQLLPGIQTNAELDAGLHIHGCENSHNMISISDVPVYNAAHMLGLFSTFNASHFAKMRIKKQITADDMTNRIGGLLDMKHSDRIPQRVNGEISVGLMSSQGTIRVPVNRNSAVTVSLRSSYLNLLYGSFLEIDDSKLEYSFSDVNITYLNRIDDSNRLYIDFYTGGDNATLNDKYSELLYNTKIKWGNILAAAHWEYNKGERWLKSSIYFSKYYNRMQMNGIYEIGLPSGIYDFGYRMSCKIRRFKFGISFIEHHISPQAPEFGSSTIKKEVVPVQRATEMSAYGKYSGNFTSTLSYELALKGDYYINNQGNYKSSSLNPSMSLIYKSKRIGELMLMYSKQHQYLLNTGFTNVGLPVEFWFGGNKDNRPQIAHNIQLLYKKELYEGKYHLDIGLYYKRLYNQIEYNSSPLDFLNEQYNLNKALLHGKGYNYGVNVSLNKCRGSIIGWFSYSYGRAMRKFDILGNKWYPANHERIHEINSVVTYRINKKMDIGTNLVFATGAPFTSPKYLYIINGNVITEFDEHNANRLKSYLRLDLSLNYDFVNKGEKSSGINISLYNALFMANRIYYRFKVYKGKYALRGESFFTRMLPSISYYYKF